LVRLPLVKGEKSAPQAATPLEDAPERLRVLVVDDNKDAADGMAMLLRQKGHDIRVAYSSESAIEAADEHRPDAVLLDIGLPLMDGCEVARRMRQNPELKNARLIAITGYGRDTDQQRAQEAGFDAHLVKPVEPHRIMELLANLTNRHGQGLKEQ
jgi:CheY-like chemotaxis protein